MMILARVISAEYIILPLVCGEQKRQNLSHEALPNRAGNHAKVGVQPTLHRALAARLAISLRRAAESRSARILPPLLPPSSPSATAAGFFLFLR
jgi:hypothetical protein